MNKERNSGFANLELVAMAERGFSGSLGERRAPHPRALPCFVG